MDRGLNELLKWGIENSDPNAAPKDAAARPLANPEALAALFGGPSDADLMKASMAAILSSDPENTLDNKMVAFDNLEQLIESLDNANNLANLALWEPLLSTLALPEPELRRMGAWCVGTAVQNNEPSQEKMFAAGGLPRLVALVVDGEEKADVRRKGVYALSSACRNYQPAMDACLQELAKTGRSGLPEKVDATNMDAVNEVMDKLKNEVAAPTS